MGANIYFDKSRNIYYIKNYLYGTNHTITHDSNGQHFTTKKSAKQFILNNIEALNTQPKTNVYSCNDIINKFFQNEKVNKKQSTYYGELLLFKKHIEPFITSFTINKIQDKDLQSFANRINKIDGSIYLKRRIFACTKNYIDLLNKYKVGKLSKDCLRVNKNSFYEKEDLNYYNFDEFKKFYQVIESTEDKLIFSLLFFYGLRISELRALEVQDFNLRDNLLSIKRAMQIKGYKGNQITSCKTKSSIRDYPLLKNVFNLFININMNQDESNCFVFVECNRNRKEAKNVIGETTIRRKNLEYANKAGLKHIRIHDFRHSCAIYLARCGYDISRIASWLGHSSINSTAIYLKYVDKEKQQIASMIDRNINERLNE